MAAPPARAVTLTIRGPLARADLVGLVERTRGVLADSGCDELHCRVVGVAADAVVADGLARLALAARRSGCSVCLVDVDEALYGLVAFMGLAEPLRARD